jgi:glycerol uptake facilitator-like aquaporin
VSLAAFVRGRLGRKDLIPYWVAQLNPGDGRTAGS